MRGWQVEQTFHPRLMLWLDSRVVIQLGHMFMRASSRLLPTFPGGLGGATVSTPEPHTPPIYPITMHVLTLGGTFLPPSPPAFSHGCGRLGLTTLHTCGLVAIVVAIHANACQLMHTRAGCWWQRLAGVLATRRRPPSRPRRCRSWRRRPGRRRSPRGCR